MSPIKTPIAIAVFLAMCFLVMSSIDDFIEGNPTEEDEPPPKTIICKDTFTPFDKLTESYTCPNSFHKLSAREDGVKCYCLHERQDLQ